MKPADAGAKGPQAAGDLAKPEKKTVSLEDALLSLGSITEGGGDGGAAFHDWYGEKMEAKEKDKPAAGGEKKNG